MWDPSCRRGTQKDAERIRGSKISWDPMLIAFRSTAIRTFIPTQEISKEVLPLFPGTTVCDSLREILANLLPLRCPDYCVLGAFVSHKTDLHYVVELIKALSRKHHDRLFVHCMCIKFCFLASSSTSTPPWHLSTTTSTTGRCLLLLQHGPFQLLFWFSCSAVTDRSLGSYPRPARSSQNSHSSGCQRRLTAVRTNRGGGDVALRHICASLGSKESPLRW